MAWPHANTMSLSMFSVWWAVVKVKVQQCWIVKVMCLHCRRCWKCLPLATDSGSLLWAKQDSSMKCLLYAGLWLGLLTDHTNGGNMFLWSVGCHQTTQHCIPENGHHCENFIYLRSFWMEAQAIKILPVFLGDEIWTYIQMTMAFAFCIHVMYILQRRQ